ncbi:hypothetical protein V6N13_136250 [Hibiscus sabdariffa]|uniref:Uncharacterized protein n=1 Tax=Hibiscus sabdariffa TaxID=183260 RepID=A0ABR2DP51_9ROSI
MEIEEFIEGLPTDAIKIKEKGEDDGKVRGPAPVIIRLEAGWLSFCYNKLAAIEQSHNKADTTFGLSFSGHDDSLASTNILRIPCSDLQPRPPPLRLGPDLVIRQTSRENDTYISLHCAPAMAGLPPSRSVGNNHVKTSN